MKKIVHTSSAMLDFSPLNHFEYPLVKALQSFGQGTFIDDISSAISSIPLAGAVLGILILFLLWRYPAKRFPLIVSVILAGVFHFTINEGLFKEILPFLGISRERPYIAFSDISPLGFPFADPSFPSSHMAFTTSMVVIFTYFFQSFLIPGILVIGLMAFSRIHNGMHFPTDVLSGTLFGSLYAVVSLFVIGK